MSARLVAHGLSISVCCQILVIVLTMGFLHINDRADLTQTALEQLFHSLLPIFNIINKLELPFQSFIDILQLILPCFQSTYFAFVYSNNLFQMVVLLFVLLNHFERYLFLFGYEHTHGSLKNDVEFVSCVVMFEHRVSLGKLFHGHRECNLL